MRRLMTAVLCLMLCAAPCCRAEEAPAAASPEAWAVLRGDLAGDRPEPVPPELRLSPAHPLPYGNEDAGLTVLLFATDAPDINRDFGRTDLLLLCRLDFAAGDIRLLSLPEDAPVRLPALPEDIMLRYVNCFGGPALLLDTVNAELDAGAWRYCAVNFDDFQAVIDDLQGVRLTLTEEEAEALETEAGERVLNGQQALRYVRLRREGEGSTRARKLLEAIIRDSVYHGTRSGIYRLMDLLLPRMDTNLTTKNLMDAAVKMTGREDAGAFSTLALSALDGAACRRFLYGEAAK